MAETHLIPKVCSMSAENVQGTVDEYMKLHYGSSSDPVKKGQDLDSATRVSNYQSLVNHYYDLVTDFYEWGWGHSFHFANRSPTESFAASIARHEHWLALKMDLQKGQNVLDVGCGVGGPAREIATFSEANVVGLNINNYHIKRADAHTAKQGLSETVSFVQGDFMKMPFPDNYFDAVYQIEATAHAPSKVGAYSEIFRVLKPGGKFGSYEWCLTEKYDPENAKHREIKKGIEVGDALPDIATTHQVIDAMEEVGFQLLMQEDRGLKTKPQDIPWYQPLTPGYVPSRFQHTWLGYTMMIGGLRSLEKVGLVAKGTTGVQEFLHTAAVYLVEGGQTGIFTPAFFTLCKKPESS